MTSLLLDTATDRGILLLAQKKRVLAVREIALGLMNSEPIMQAIDALFAECALHLEELSYIAVGIGPGSYTGIRVGVAVAKALSLACKLPLVGISGLYGFVPEKSSASSNFLSVIDARIGGMYVIEHINEKSSEPKLIPLELFLALLERFSVIVTPSLDSIKRRLEDASAISIIERAPSISVLHELAEKKFQKGEYCLDGELPILYLRQTQAEIEKGRLPNITF
jgi:tRNA threonylcarbamoyladenosine biosynthesis protein TsaB